MSEQAGRRSSEDLMLIHRGATASDLATIFGMSPQEVNRRIVGKVMPTTTLNKLPRYAIRDAAPFLCNVVFDPEEFIKKMSPEKLPPKLQESFWKGQRSRLAYEEERGDLWRTDKVIKVIADAFKSIRMTVLMFSDTVEQTTQLTQEQRDAINGLGDGLLESLHKSMIKQFEDYVAPPDEHGMPISGMPDDEDAIVVKPVVDEEEYDDGFD